MARATKPAYVDTGNPALAIDCPACGLLTPRFLLYCKNCGHSLWPNSHFASAAFAEWRATDPARAHARRYDLELPVPSGATLVDYDERAHRLGIHVFPSSSNSPFVICVGLFFLALAAVPFPGVARIALGVIGLAVFLFGVVGWVVVEDVKLYPGDEPPGHAGHEDSAGHPGEHYHVPREKESA